MEIKYYIIHSGCMGWIGNRYILFPTENDYFDYIAGILADSREN